MRPDRRLSTILLSAVLGVTGCAGTSPDAAQSGCQGVVAPLAVGGPDRQAALGATVHLDGTSYGTVGAATALWQLESIPPGSQAVLDQPASASATFVADRPGTYVASFQVRDTCSASAADAVAITVPGETCPGAPPVAVTDGDRVVLYRNQVTVNGGGSHASGGQQLSYRWWVASRPVGSNGSLSAFTGATTQLYPDRSGAYVVGLVVNDGCQDSIPLLTTLTYPDQAPSVYSNPSGDQPVLVPTWFTVSAVNYYNDILTYAWTLVSRPDGSAATLSDPTAASPSLTPDLPGTYTASVVVTDGTASSAPVLVTFRAVDPPPVASAGADLATTAGATVSLDGSASADVNRTPLTFAWTLAGPAASRAVLARADTARPTFVPDVAGRYRATLTVTSGGQSSQDSVDVAAWPTVRALPHRVIDAAYSSALERIVTVAADPHALYLLDPTTGTEEVVPLASAPSALSLAPDGLSAAVGHSGAITVVDLVGRTAGTPVAVTGDVADLVLGSAGTAWYVPRPASTTDKARLVMAPLAGGAGSWVTSSFTGPARVRLRPGNPALYLAGGSYPSGVEHYSVTGGTPALVNSVSVYNNSGCGDLWFSQDGARLFSGCGNVYLASSAWSEDLTAAGNLTRIQYGYLSIHHLDDSTAAGELSAFTGSDSGYYAYGTTNDQVLRRWTAADLTQREALPLPTATVGGQPYRWAGRYVFYRSDGTARFELLQLDPMAGVVDDFGWTEF